MKVNIVYFTRTGTTQTAAQALNQTIDSTLFELTDDMKWSGLLGFIKGGYYASSNKTVKINVDADYAACDHLIVMSPLWAGGPTPAIKTFLRECNHSKISLVLTNAGSDLNKAFNHTKEQFPNLHKIYGISKKLQNQETVIQTIKHDFDI